MVNERYWIALFSQTGSEIVNLSKEIGIEPDFIFTNNSNTSQWHPDIKTISSTVICDSHLNIMEGIKEFNNPLITLHGYLRIIPSDICNQFEIYNGHPGAVELYPELKGKDPQQKVINDITRYQYIGSVVHQVIEEVDSGKIIARCNVFNTCTTDIEIFKELKYTSLKAWGIFFSLIKEG